MRVALLILCGLCALACGPRPAAWRVGPQPSASAEPSEDEVGPAQAEPPPSSEPAAQTVVVTSSGPTPTQRYAHFEPDEAEVRAEDLPFVEEVAEVLLEHPSIVVAVVGYRAESEPPVLALARAESLRARIVARGVEEARLRPYAAPVSDSPELARAVGLQILERDGVVTGRWNGERVESE